jgi:hypothetical protein
LAEYYRGIKAGVVAGVIYAMIDSVVFFVLGPALLEVSSASWPAMMLLFLGSLTVGAVVGGVISGLIYATLYEELPTKSPTTKGIIVGAIFWVIFGVAMNVIYLTALFFLIESFVLKALVFGAMLSFFWKLFETKK